MYACMHVCVYVCLNVCMFACMHVRMYLCMNVCMYACMHVCKFACMYVHIPERIESAILRRIDIARSGPCFHEAHLCVCVCECFFVLKCMSVYCAYILYACFHEPHYGWMPHVDVRQ